MGFTERACVKVTEAISAKSRTSQTDMVDLTSPTEDEDTTNNNNEILFVKNTKLKQEDETEKMETDNIVQEDEKHESNGEAFSKDGKQAEN